MMEWYQMDTKKYMHLVSMDLDKAYDRVPR